jgi:hypothetical protein
VVFCLTVFYCIVLFASCKNVLSVFRIIVCDNEVQTVRSCNIPVLLCSLGVTNFTHFSVVAQEVDDVYFNGVIKSNL